MKKILVPTDFSDTSRNAALYAVRLASNIPGSTIILYHVYDSFAAGTDGSALTETPEDRQKIYTLAFANLTAEISAAPIPVQTVAEEGRSLLASAEQYIRENQIDLVVMGITGASKIDQVVMGSNAVDMAKEGVCPVIIVPPNASFKPIENVLLATDFKDVESTVPVSQIRSILDIFKPILHIVHAGGERSSTDSDGFTSEKAWLEKAFDANDPDFYFIHSNDFMEAISNFTSDHHIDLIITIPKNHSFLNSFYRGSHTKKLAYHSHVPILAIHE